uniref:G_PROTEIN_RECEP_F1_2 domain-containing protein n=1 Tax=Steinernema glaseri TaxID=37863 RepID=A0A1I7Y1Z7_9BILA
MDALHVGVGALYLTISLTLFVLNCLIFLTLHYSNEYRRGTQIILKSIVICCMIQLLPFIVGSFMTIFRTTFSFYVDRTLHYANEYRRGTQIILKSIVICCMIQLLPFTVGSFMTIFRTTFSFYVDRVFGVVVLAFWFPYVGLSASLAIDRAMIFMATNELILRSRISRLLTSASWLSGLAVLITLSLPDFGYTYVSAEGLFGWSCYQDRHGAAVLATVELYYDLILIGLIMVVYLVTLLYIVTHRKSSTQSTIEKKIFIIAIVAYIYETIFVIYCFTIPQLFRSKVAMRIVLNLMWMLDPGMFALVTMLISGTMRRNMKALLWKTPVKTNVVNIAVN